MNIVYSVVGLAGTIALMLWGIRMVQTGVQRAFGARLRGFLATAIDNRLKAFLAGMASPPFCKAARRPG